MSGQVKSIEDLKELASEGKLVGEFHGIPEDVYHEGPGISRSDLMKIMKSPEHLEYEKEREKTETPALILGTALHCYILEPDKFDATYVSLPEGMARRGKRYQAILDDMEDDQILLSFSDMEKTVAMGEKFKSHKVCAEFLEGSEREVTYYWNDPKTDLLCKARLDIVHPKLGAMDIKTTSEDARRTSFMRTCVKYCYDLQAAHYWYGAAAAQGRDYSFYFGVIEKSEPHGVVVHKADHGFIECGLEIQNFLLKKLDSYLSQKSSYGYPEEVVSLSLPSWAFDLDARLERDWR